MDTKIADGAQARGEDEHPWGRSMSPGQLFARYGACVVRVQVRTGEGDLANGTAFHIGGGAFATAAHVVAGMSDIELFERDTTTAWDEGHPVTEVLRHPDADIDLAVLLSPLWRDRFGDHSSADAAQPAAPQFIDIPEMWGEWIEDSLMLSKGMICGYPRVPFARAPYKIAVSAEINADINRYDRQHVHFIVSATARGGFSGAPFMSEFDMLLGVVIESLHEDNDTSFMAVIATEPLIEILDRNEALLRGRLDHYLTSWSRHVARDNEPAAG